MALIKTSLQMNKKEANERLNAVIVNKILTILELEVLEMEMRSNNVS